MFLLYDNEGAVRQVCQAPDATAPGLAEASAFQYLLLEEAPPTDVLLSSYVENESLAAKMPMFLSVSSTAITADGVDSAVVSAIPAEVYVIWPDGVRELVTDGEVELAVTQPGTYTLIFEGVKFLREEVVIEASN